MNVELKWIDVLDELPPGGEYPVLIAMRCPKPNVSLYLTAWYSRPHREWYAYPSYKHLELARVTHWMRLNIPDPLTVEADREH